MGSRRSPNSSRDTKFQSEAHAMHISGIGPSGVGVITEQDKADMFRMGRTERLVVSIPRHLHDFSPDAFMQRKFDFWSIFSFVIVAVGSWEVAILWVVQRGA